MAYSPVERGRLLTQPGICDMAASKGDTPAQIALAWLVKQDGIIAIPKAGTMAHIRENRAAADVTLSESDLARLDKLFPRPSRPTPLEML